jgi:alpha-glucosidase (family GH31 glycosyl hydrolase)
MRCWNESAGPWGEGLHKNVPFFMSSRGYGLYINSSCPQLFEMGVRSHDSYAFAVADEVMDLFFIYGPSFNEIIETYTEITGRPAVPPAWSFGIWMSRNAYRSREEMEAVGARMRENGFPATCSKLDVGWFSRPDAARRLTTIWSGTRTRFPTQKPFSPVSRAGLQGVLIHPGLGAERECDGPGSAFTWLHSQKHQRR